MTILILGAGLIGRDLSTRLIDRGDTVTVASRRGTPVPGARAVALDVADSAALTRAADGADVIVNAINPRYGEWPTAWPPAFAAIAATASATSAAVVQMGNLYSYGRAVMPMTESSPEQPTEEKGRIRMRGWRTILEAADRSGFRAVEVRASDYFGPTADSNAHLGSDFFGPVLAGRTARVVGDPSLAHSWAFLPDIVRTLEAAIDAHGDGSRIWHVPPASDLPRTRILEQLRDRYGATGRISRYPDVVLRAIGLFSPDLREVQRSSYQFTAPFIDDASETTRLLGITATPWDEALEATVRANRLF
ncbi:NAD-dependent epimerase/dehydratase family protein [Microbacteriaceae bacterium VKM Ac-2855]|nr:NAD-dependent epimerase/dehydratase family protein [Microbacteriaceae bacterium VKM Ac-2855]